MKVYEVEGQRVYQIGMGNTFARVAVRPFTDACFRIKGYGLALRDHRAFPPLFSERYNGQHGVRKRFYLHVGPWCLKALGDGI